MNTASNEPWAHDTEYTRYTLWFIYACIIYSIIGFSWGALMGGIAEFRHFVDHRLHGDLIVRAHTHINLLGWVEMAIFGAVYYLIPRLVKPFLATMGIFGTIVLLANFVWAFNLFRTCAGWNRRQ